MNSAIEAARAAGHDALIAHNVDDLKRVKGASAPQTQVAVFHPKNIRSVFGTFDPATESGTDLMSAGGVGAIPTDDRQSRGAGGGMPPEVRAALDYANQLPGRSRYAYGGSVASGAGSDPGPQHGN